MRLERRRVGDIDVIFDCYNSSPDSLDAALDHLESLAEGGRRGAILGDMLELGPLEIPAHEAVGRRLARAPIEPLLLVGTAMGHALRSCREAGRDVDWVPDVAAARRWLADKVVSGDVILVKASRALALERIFEEAR